MNTPNNNYGEKYTPIPAHSLQQEPEPHQEKKLRQEEPEIIPYWHQFEIEKIICLVC